MRTVVNVAASIAPAPSAMRVRMEFAAKATSASAVSSAVIRAMVARVCIAAGRGRVAHSHAAHRRELLVEVARQHAPRVRIALVGDEHPAGAVRDRPRQRRARVAGRHAVHEVNEPLRRVGRHPRRRRVVGLVLGPVARELHHHVEEGDVRRAEARPDRQIGARIARPHRVRHPVIHRLHRRAVGVHRPLGEVDPRQRVEVVVAVDVGDDVRLRARAVAGRHVPDHDDPGRLRLRDHLGVRRVRRRSRTALGVEHDHPDRGRARDQALPLGARRIEVGRHRHPDRTRLRRAPRRRRRRTAARRHFPCPPSGAAGSRWSRTRPPRPPQARPRRRQDLSTRMIPPPPPGQEHRKHRPRVVGRWISSRDRVGIRR